MYKENVSSVVRKDLCVGCGICGDICPKGCIEIKHGDYNHPEVQDSLCISCGKCLKTCPGKGMDLDKMQISLFDYNGIKHNKYIGYYDLCFSGYSTDYEIRYHGASGGAVSQFLIFLLEQKLIDGAVVVGFQEESPRMKPKVYIARNRQDIINARSSKYCVVAYDGVIKEIEKYPGKYAVVGLPCHIQGFRQAANLLPKFKERMIGYFAIYCSTAKNMLSQDYFLYRYKVDKNKVARFSYRDYGCMGSMVFEDFLGRDVVDKIPYLSYYLGAKGFFTPWRCLLCIDHFGELADVCFGDIQVGEFTNDKVGVNSIISRNSYWSDLLMKAKDAGRLDLKYLDVETLVASQAFCRNQKKGPGIVAEYKVRRLMGKVVPVYDQPFVSSKAYMKDYVKSMMRLAMRFIGKRRSLWWIIKMMDKNKD